MAEKEYNFRGLGNLASAVGCAVGLIAEGQPAELIFQTTPSEVQEELAKAVVRSVASILIRQRVGFQLQFTGKLNATFLPIETSEEEE